MVSEILTHVCGIKDSFSLSLFNTPALTHTYQRVRTHSHANAHKRTHPRSLTRTLAHPTPRQKTKKKEKMMRLQLSFVVDFLRLD